MAVRKALVIVGNDIKELPAGDTLSGTSGGLTWNVITASQSIAASNGYITNGGALVVCTLPATAAVGDEFIVTALNSNGWKVAQNASQLIQIGNQVTTTGTGGYLQSNATGDSIRLICAVANTTFIVINSTGNITYI